MEILISRKIILALVFLATISLYVSYTFNTCLVGRITKALPKWHGGDLSRAHRLPSFPEKFQNTETLVRFVSLTDDLASITSSDLSPKYQLLREQGLTPTTRLPHALIIGVKKCGTRALLEFIRVHPDVRAAGNEVHFFDRHYAHGLHWYRAQMPPTLDGQLTIEKTPSYWVTRETPRRVHHMSPSVKLLVVVRDPVTRAISDYTQACAKRNKHSPSPPFERLLFTTNRSDEDEGGVVGGDGSGAVIDTSWGPVKLGLYARYLSRWLHYFPLSQFLFVSGERLIVDPAAELRRVQDFLGLKPVVNERHFYFNTTKGFPCLFKSEGRSTPHCLGKTKGRAHPYIKPAALDRLRNFYRPFNLRFYQMTAINFGWS